MKNPGTELFVIFLSQHIQRRIQVQRCADQSRYSEQQDDNIFDYDLFFHNYYMPFCLIYFRRIQTVDLPGMFFFDQNDIDSAGKPVLMFEPDDTFCLFFAF